MADSLLVTDTGRVVKRVNHTLLDFKMNYSENRIRPSHSGIGIAIFRNPYGMVKKVKKLYLYGNIEKPNEYDRRFYVFTGQ